MKTVIFKKKFATKKKGDEGTYDNALASRLVRKLKVADFYNKKKPKAKK